jgi:AraC-like DNA-binding protein
VATLAVRPPSSPALSRQTLCGDVTFHDAAQVLLLVVASGRARLSEGGTESLLGTGTVLVVPRARTLTLRSAEQLKLTLLSFDVTEQREALEALGRLGLTLLTPGEGPTTLLGLAPRHLDALSEVLSRIELELEQPRLGHDLFLQAQLLELLVMLARSERIAEPDPGRHRARLEHTLAFIHERYNEQLSLAALARHAGMSISRFSCLFRESLGTSPLEYVAATRMREARKLLRTPGQSIAEVAYAVGFQDSNYFSRSFKQHHGMSPREFRDVSRIAG